MQKKKKNIKTYEVIIDYPSECMVVEAESPEEASNKALEMLGEVTLMPSKVCVANAEEVKK